MSCSDCQLANTARGVGTLFPAAEDYRDGLEGVAVIHPVRATVRFMRLTSDPNQTSSTSRTAAHPRCGPPSFVIYHANIIRLNAAQHLFNIRMSSADRGCWGAGLPDLQPSQTPRSTDGHNAGRCVVGHYVDVPGRRSVPQFLAVWLALLHEGKMRSSRVLRQIEICLLPVKVRVVK